MTDKEKVTNRNGTFLSFAADLKVLPNYLYTLTGHPFGGCIMGIVVTFWSSWDR